MSANAGATPNAQRRPLGLAIPLYLIDEQRARGWPDFHPEEFCHRCGGVNVPSWYVDSDRFNAAMGERHLWPGRCSRHRSIRSGL